MCTFHQVNFEEGKLLWRAYWVENSNETDNRGTLVLNVHPSLSDSKGLFLLMNDALGEIDQILTGQSVRYRTEATNSSCKFIAEIFFSVLRNATPKMHSNVEETVNIESGMTFMEKLSMYKHMIMFMIPWTSTYMRTHPAPIVPDYKTRHIQIEVPLELSKKILKNVQNNGVSLHAAWTAAAGIAMHEILNLKDKTKFRSTHEVDLRVLTNDYDSKECKLIFNICDFFLTKFPPTSDFPGRLHGIYCNYVEDVIETNRVTSQEEFWNFATSVHKSLFEKMHSDKLLKMMKYCGQFGDMYNMFATLGSTRSVRNDYAIAVHDNVDSFIDDRNAIQVFS